MQSRTHDWFGPAIGLLLLFALSGVARSETGAAKASAATVEVVAIQVAHPGIPRPARLMVRAGQMATVEIGDRAFGFRVPMLDEQRAMLEIVALERVRKIGSDARPEYRALGVIEQRQVETGRTTLIEAVGMELSVSRDRIIRAPQQGDGSTDKAGAKGPDDICCLSCGETTSWCGHCVTASCGLCCGG